MIQQLIADVSEKNIQDFFRKKISSFTPETEDLSDSIPEKEYELFSDLTKLGEAAYKKNNDELLVFSCKYKGELSERSAKKKQFDIAKKVLKEDVKDAAIFIFYDDIGQFRFSFISKKYGEEDGKYTNWRRFTYFVSPKQTNKTFKDRIEKCNFSSLENIQTAFSVEPLNRDFYEKISIAFYQLVGTEKGKAQGALTLPKNDNNRTIKRQFAVRLLGRLIFCWFLKHKTSTSGKSLIPTDWLSADNVTPNYYHDILEKLFFEVLNREPSERAKDLPKNHVDIPFLNGGLFEPHQSENDSDFYKYAKFGIPNFQLTIKDTWFKELFQTLEQYNFTIDENSLNDAEVSIDPEMLGRIFENLLAEIDPNSNDTTSVRKATGSFYTPREIVDYMVEEALVRYLHNQTGFELPKLYTLFADIEELPFDSTQQQQLINAFSTVKILDPASGSGAFPMGMLQKIISALELLDPNADVWKAEQLANIPNAALRKEMRKVLDRENATYIRKIGVLQQCIYGADIQPIAAEISRLRGFLSLIVEAKVTDEVGRGIKPLPNLEFKFVTANTLKNLNPNRNSEFDGADKLIEALNDIRTDYLQAHGKEKETLKKRYSDIQQDISLKQAATGFYTKGTYIDGIVSWSPFENNETDWFDAKLMFDVEQFDIIIGNPPYGGDKISTDLQKELGLGSKDPYGAFIAKYLRNNTSKTPLKHQGILAFIVSDTFMTIKSHKQLRAFMMNNTIHQMIRVHKDTFKATVNTAIILCERTEKNEKKNNQTVLMADFTNTSIHDNYQRFIELMHKIQLYQQPDYKTEHLQQGEILYMKGNNWTSESSPEYAVYTYPQTLIDTNTNQPFFVASPKLFGLMKDKKVKTVETEIEGKAVKATELSFNNKKMQVVKLGEIAEVKQGLATGDNNAYLFQNPEARGNYKSINDFKAFLLTETDLDTIRNNEKLRLKIINKGISKDKISSERYFGGRYIVPYDKGGESNAAGGWMPNYYVPTNYFIDWSEWAINRMKTLTIGERDNKVDKRICSRFQNVEYSFLDFCTFSRTGAYAPTFRFGESACFDSKSNAVVFLQKLNNITIANSKIFKNLFKNYWCHTVQAEGDAVLEFPLIISNNKGFTQLVKSIIKNQKQDLQYDYASHEQLKIDYLVYQAYGLNWSDVAEVENWYARRYEKLVAAQKRNLAALGKPTDYVAIYKGFVGEFGDLG